jgi:hypothetical protein
MAVAMRQFQLFPDSFSGTLSSAVLSNSSIALGIICFLSSNTVITSSAPLYNGGSVGSSSQIVSVQSTFAGGGTVYGSWFLLPDVTGGGTSLSVTCNGALSASVGMIGAEITGLGATPSLDSVSPNPATAIGTTGTVTSGATGAITSATSAVLGSAAAFGTAITPPAGWNAQQFSSNFAAAGYQLPSVSGGTYTFNNSSVGQPWFADAVVIKGTASNPVTNTLLISALP